MCLHSGVCLAVQERHIAALSLATWAEIQKPAAPSTCYPCRLLCSSTLYPRTVSACLVWSNQAHNPLLLDLGLLLELPAVQERHISSLFSQAQQLSQQLIAARADASAAQAAAAAARQAAATLGLQLESAVSEAEALRRAAAAATQEAAGVAQWCLSRPPGSSLQGSNSSNSGSNGGSGEESVGEALRRRDEGLLKWFEARVAGLLKQQQSQQGQGKQQQEDARLIALVREVRIHHSALSIRSTMQVAL